MLKGLAQACHFSPCSRLCSRVRAHLQQEFALGRHTQKTSWQKKKNTFWLGHRSGLGEKNNLSSLEVKVKSARKPKSTSIGPGDRIGVSQLSQKTLKRCVFPCREPCSLCFGACFECTLFRLLKLKTSQKEPLVFVAVSLEFTPALRDLRRPLLNSRLRYKSR